MQSIKVKDKTYSFCWGTLALLNTCDKIGCTLQELDYGIMADDAKYFYNLSYQALLANDLTLNNGANVIDGELDGLSYAQYLNWLDNAPQSTGDKITQSFLKSKYLGKSMEQRYNELFEKIGALTPAEEQSQEPAKTVKKKKEALAK